MSYAAYEKFTGKSGAKKAPESQPEVKKERVGIFMREWKVVTKYGINSMNSHIKTYRAGQMVFKEDEMISYILQGAPLRVYIHDVEFTGGTD